MRAAIDAEIDNALETLDVDFTAPFERRRWDREDASKQPGTHAEPFYNAIRFGVLP